MKRVKTITKTFVLLLKEPQTTTTANFTTNP